MLNQLCIVTVRVVPVNEQFDVTCTKNIPIYLYYGNSRIKDNKNTKVYSKMLKIRLTKLEQYLKPTASLSAI